jgi:hypothetical protein
MPDVATNREPSHLHGVLDSVIATRRPKALEVRSLFQHGESSQIREILIMYLVSQARRWSRVRHWRGRGRKQSERKRGRSPRGFTRAKRGAPRCQLIRTCNNRGALYIYHSALQQTPSLTTHSPTSPSARLGRFCTEPLAFESTRAHASGSSKGSAPLLY